MILTYEAQHAAIVSGLPARVANKDWKNLAGDAQDLSTLESMIEKAPAPAAVSNPALATVMVHPLPNK